MTHSLRNGITHDYFAMNLSLGISAKAAALFEKIVRLMKQAQKTCIDVNNGYLSATLQGVKHTTLCTKLNELENAGLIKRESLFWNKKKHRKIRLCGERYFEIFPNGAFKNSRLNAFVEASFESIFEKSKVRKTNFTIPCGELVFSAFTLEKPYHNLRSLPSDYEATWPHELGIAQSPSGVNFPDLKAESKDEDAASQPSGGGTSQEGVGFASPVLYQPGRFALSDRKREEANLVAMKQRMVPLEAHELELAYIQFEKDMCGRAFKDSLKIWRGVVKLFLAKKKRKLAKELICTNIEPIKENEVNDMFVLTELDKNARFEKTPLMVATEMLKNELIDERFDERHTSETVPISKAWIEAIADRTGFVFTKKHLKEFLEFNSRPTRNGVPKIGDLFWLERMIRFAWRRQEWLERQPVDLDYRAAQKAPQMPIEAIGDGDFLMAIKKKVGEGNYISWFGNGMLLPKFEDSKQVGYIFKAANQFVCDSIFQKFLGGASTEDPYKLKSIGLLEVTC